MKLIQKMESEYFCLEFNSPWFGNTKLSSVDEFLLRLDLGEGIPIKDLVEACRKEGRNFKIEFINE